MSFDNLLRPFTGIPSKKRYRVLFSISGVGQSRTFFNYDQAAAFANKLSSRGIADYVRGPFEI